LRVGISGTHGTGKTTLAEALCANLPGYLVASEPYYQLEDEGHEFGFPPSLDDYRALLGRSVQSLCSAPRLPGVVFDRTPLDYLAYMAAIGAVPSSEAGAVPLKPAGLTLLPRRWASSAEGDPAGREPLSSTTPPTCWRYAPADPASEVNHCPYWADLRVLRERAAQPVRRLAKRHPVSATFTRFSWSSSELAA
jgi:hypothetical protein